MSASFSFSSPTTSTATAPVTLSTASAAQLLSRAATANTGSAAAANQQSSVSRIAADLLALNRSSVAGSRAATAVVASRAATSNAAAGSSAYLSELENTILRAAVPIESQETEEITVNGERGQWLNRQEVVNWKGVIPIEQYIINADANPEIITKRTQQQLEYIQELAIRYLRPPTPPAPGEIIIRQDINTLVPPAPPLIIRQQPARPDTPEPLVIREAPPQPPAQVGKKVITISGKRIPPPPRKVIIERLAALPVKPQSILVERWLPYAQVKRRVIFQGAQQADPCVIKPRNVIIQWEAPQVNVRKEIKYLGVIRANPVEYVQRYGASLKVARDLPQYVLDIKTPQDVGVLAAEYQYNSLHELEGDIKYLGLVDLNREGLSEYREYLAKLGITYNGESGRLSVAGSNASFAATSANIASLVASRAATNVSRASNAGSRAASAALVVASSSARAASANSNNIQQAFLEVDQSSSGKITRSDAERALLRLNSKLGRNYGEDDVQAFFATLDLDGNGTIDLQEFRTAFAKAQ